MKTRVIACILFLLWVPHSAGQGLFEDATQDAEESKLAFDLWGYVRSVLYMGQASDPESGEIKSAYGEFALKLKAGPRGYGSAFAEVRMREGQEFDHRISEFNLREAYIDTYAGRFDFRVGHQIVVWGRADGLNPTDNITPKDMLVRSPDEDDRRLANFLLRTTYNVYPVKLELIWIPIFKPSRMPTEFIDFPPGIIYAGQNFPSARLENSGVALKLSLELAKLDGSLSYFNGYNPWSGLSAVVHEIPPLEPQDTLVKVFLKTYRMHVFGGDFSTTVGSCGLRGEVAYRRSQEDYKTNLHVINPDVYYVVGIDREFLGGVSFILQYLGRYVIDFEELEVPSHPALLPIYNLAFKNTILASQQFQWSHSVSSRLAASLFHETLSLELMGLVNLTSQEYMLRPKLDYSITDAFSLILGGELYRGPDDTLFHLVEKNLSGFFGELRLSF